MVNREQPAQAPTAPMGDVPVIVRLQWSDGLEEWRPARAVRWTRTHVMVGWRPDPEPVVRGRRPAAGAPQEHWLWVRAPDVLRSASWLVPPRSPVGVGAVPRVGAGEFADGGPAGGGSGGTARAGT